MRVSYRWLQEYVDIRDISPQELAELLTRAGVAVDTVEKLDKGVEKVVTGFILEKKPHLNADKLSVCHVDVKDAEPLQIVCGAKNVAAGQKVPVALVGAKLPGGVQIKKSKLRGVVSQGMICSAKELGLYEKHLSREQTEGILVLPDDVEVGIPIQEIVGLDDDVLELDLTPNRSDCLSMIGVAYEVAAILDREVILPKIEAPETEVSEASVAASCSVRIESPELCHRYVGRLIQGVHIAPSPLWMQNRLRAAGMRPVNNIVDVTNYVMLEFGQPLHAFDFDKIRGGQVVVRTAREGEKITTLDGVTRALSKEMLLITDGENPIGIAGVMGGANSEVDETTTTLFLESAKFDGASVRRTSRQLGLRSEASQRFEKGVAMEWLVPAADRAVQLIAELAGGVMAGSRLDAYPIVEEEVFVPLCLSRVNRLLGTEVKSGEVERILRRLGLKCVQKEMAEEDEVAWEVQIPSRRGDLSIEADLIEEVARIYGYEKIPTTLPEGPVTVGRYTCEQKLRRRIREWLADQGMCEVMTYTFISPDQVDQVEGLENGTVAIRLRMPMSEAHSYLRTGLIPSLLEVAAYNHHRQTEDLAIFELGKIFIAREQPLQALPLEKWVLAGLMTGEWQSHWSGEREKVDFFRLKGLVEGLLCLTGLKQERVRFEPDKGAKQFHPGRTASFWCREERLGMLGQLHPSLAESYDLQEVYVFQIDLEKIFALTEGQVIHYRPLPRVPSVTRDLAVVVKDEVSAEALMRAIRQAAGELLASLQLFDVYRGKPLAKDEKSLAFSLHFRHPERTLTDEEATSLHSQVVQALAAQFGARLR